MAEINSQIEFLEEAMHAAEAIDRDRNSCENLLEQESALKEEQNRLKKAIEKEKDETVSLKRKEIIRGFDHDISKTEGEIRKTGDKRQKARNQGVRERISQESEGTAGELRNLKREFSDRLQEKGMGLCACKAYYILFMPRGFSEVLLRFAIAVIELIGIPFAVIALSGITNTFYIALICLAAVIVFGGLHVWIHMLTRGKNEEIIRIGRDLLSRIRRKEKELVQIRKRITGDTDDSHYSLQSFDDQLAQLNQKKAGLAVQKEEALRQFDNVTKNVIMDGIDTAHRAEVDAQNRSIEETEAQIAALRAAISEAETASRSRYSAVLGEYFMDRNGISRMIETRKQEIAEAEARAALEAARTETGEEAGTQAAAEAQETPETAGAEMPAAEETASDQPEID